MGKLILRGFGGPKRPSDYPKNWEEISRKFREKNNYKCAYCGVDCSAHPSLIDVHHINGVKSDCRDKNLKCLCTYHHYKQPLHNNLKHRANKNIELLRQLWKEQNIPAEKRG